MRIEDSLLKYGSVLKSAIDTGQQSNQAANANNQPQKLSFEEVLKQKTQTSELTFSKHALSRIEQREINLSLDDLNKLSGAVKKAEEKGLDNTLILSGKGAFIINVPNNIVITAMNNDDMKENIFTQIDGAVII